MPGSLNDINVVNRSPLMNKIANGELPPVQFVANGRTYNYGYYLADGIYPKWQTFVKSLKSRKVVTCWRAMLNCRCLVRAFSYDDEKGGEHTTAPAVAECSCRLCAAEDDFPGCACRFLEDDPDGLDQNEPW
nr:uncharacterized protein LOC109750567 [Aegilops tauschii subsp. strangulata]